MKIYQSKLQYSLISEGAAVALDSPDIFVRYMAGAFDEDPTVEWLFSIMLDRKNRPLGRVTITKGTATNALAHPREVFKAAIIAGAVAIIVAHNHPSGDPAPSRADIQVTRNLREASKIIGIDLLDHIIIGDPSDDPTGLGYYSFNDAGLI